MYLRLSTIQCKYIKEQIKGLDIPGITSNEYLSLVRNVSLEISEVSNFTVYDCQMAGPAEPVRPLRPWSDQKFVIYGQSIVFSEFW